MLCPYDCANKTEYGYCKTTACINQKHDHTWSACGENGNWLNFIPVATKDAVVRCKDCKWWHTNCCAFRNDCVNGLPSEDDYCSHGQRKE